MTTSSRRTFRSAGHFMWEASGQARTQARAGLPGASEVTSAAGDCRPAVGMGDSQEFRLKRDRNGNL